MFIHSRHAPPRNNGAAAPVFPGASTPRAGRRPILELFAFLTVMAVAGFGEGDLSITTENNKLTVSGTRRDEEETEENAYLYRGIATRSFERRFNLADHVRVSGARLDNGLLHIELEREIPEAMKPRQIEIQSRGKLIENRPEDKAA